LIFDKRRAVEYMVLVKKALEENEDRYRQIYQFSPYSIIIHDFDMNILNANDKAVKEFGYSKENCSK